MPKWPNLPSSLEPPHETPLTPETLSTSLPLLKKMKDGEHCKSPATPLKVQFIVPDIKSIHFAPHLMKRVGGICITDLHHSHGLYSVIKDIQDISLSFENLINDQPKKSLSSSFERVKDSYINIFEKMLGTVLKLERKKDKMRDEKERENYEFMQDLQNKVNHLEERNTALLKACNAKDIVARIANLRIIELEKDIGELEGIINAPRDKTLEAQRAQQIAEKDAMILRKELKKLQKENENKSKELETFFEDGQDKKESDDSLKDARFLQKLRRKSVATDYEKFHEAMSVVAKSRPVPGQNIDMAALRKEIEAEIRSSIKPPEPVIIYKEKIIYKTKEVERKVAHLKTSVNVLEQSTQTEITEDDGLWDVADAICEKTVKGPVSARWKWLDAFNYSRCSHCHKKITKNKNLKYTDLKKIALKGKQKKKSEFGNFAMSEYFKDFLSNIPKSVINSKVKPLPWLLEMIGKIYKEKNEADIQDMKDGTPSSSFEVYITELFLFECGLRRLAELKIYEILMSVKENLKTGGLAVVTFARMLGCLTYKEEGDKYSKIDKSICSAFIYCRKRLLSLPPQWPKPIIINDGVQIWLPIEPAVSFIKNVISFLPPRKLEMLCRRIEENAGILNKAGTSITLQSEIIGSRLDVRAAMRRAMIDNEGVVSNDETDKKKTIDKKESKKEEPNIFVNAHEVLDVIIEALYIRKIAISDELKKSFSDGDSNGDGVLSYKEFLSILQELPYNTGPTNVSARKGLHIFRDALSFNGEGLSISKDTFVNICLNYDLVPLIDTTSIEIAEMDLESKKINASFKDSTKLSTVIAQKENAAKASLLDLARGIESVKFHVEKAPINLRGKISRLMKNLDHTLLLLHSDVAKILPNTDFAAIALEAQSNLPKGFQGIPKGPASNGTTTNLLSPKRLSLANIINNNSETLVETPTKRRLTSLQLSSSSDANSESPNNLLKIVLLNNTSNKSSPSKPENSIYSFRDQDSFKG